MAARSQQWRRRAQRAGRSHKTRAVQERVNSIRSKKTKHSHRPPTADPSAEATENRHRLAHASSLRPPRTKRKTVSLATCVLPPSTRPLACVPLRRTSCWSALSYSASPSRNMRAYRAKSSPCAKDDHERPWREPSARDATAARAGAQSGRSVGASIHRWLRNLATVRQFTESRAICARGVCFQTPVDVDASAHAPCCGCLQSDRPRALAHKGRYRRTHR